MMKKEFKPSSHIRNFLTATFVFISFCLSSQIIYSDTVLTTQTQQAPVPGVLGLSFELEVRSPVAIQNIVAHLRSVGNSDCDVYLREGGVQHIPGEAPIILPSYGWNKMSLVNFTTTNNGDLTYSNRMGKYGKGILLNKGKYGVFLSNENFSLAFVPWPGNDSLFTNQDSVVFVNSGPNRTYRTGGLPNVATVDTPFFRGGVVYEEFPYTPNDVSILSVDSAYGNCLGMSPMYVSLRNYGSNKINSVTVNWSVNGIIQPPYQFMGVLDTIGGIGSTDTMVNIGNINITNTQSNAVKVWTSIPNGTVDSNPINDTLEIDIKPALPSGVYTINPNLTGANNFSSFGQLSNVLNERGVCGSVVFNIAPGVYTDHLFLTDLFKTTGPNKTIVFDGGDTSLVKLSFTSVTDTPTIYLKGTDYVTIRNMTIENTSSGDAWGVMLQSEANYNIIEYCKIVLPISSSSDMAGVVSSSTLDGESDGNNANFLTVSNNTFIGGEAGITLHGTQTRPYCEGNVLRSNIFRFQYDHGIEVYNQTELQVVDNDIDSMASNGADAMLIYDSDAFTISSNRIIATDWGLRVLNGNDGYAGASRSVIKNNMISSYTDRALILDIDKTDVLYNSARGTYGLLVQHQAEVSMRNNIFYGFSSPAAVFQEAFSSADIVDYNIFYSSTSTLLQYDGTSFASVQDYRNVDKTHNAHSFQGDPFFSSSEDLHLTGWFANNRGDASVTVSDDIDGQSRGGNPDIGADQFEPDSVSCLPVTGYIIDYLGATSVDLVFDDAIGDSIQVEWGPCGFTQGNGGVVFGTSPLSINSLVAESCYEFYARRTCDTASGSFTAWAGPFEFETACSGSLSGTYTINAALPGSTINFQSFGAAIDRLNSCGIAGPVLFNVAPGIYAEDVVIPEVLGSSATNTLRFNGQDTSNTILSGNQGETVLEIKGTDWLTISNLQILHNGGTSRSNGILVSNQTKYLSVNNCRISVMGTGTTSAHAVIRAEDDNLGWGENLMINDNILLGGRFGIVIEGRQSIWDSVITISNNTIRNAYNFGINAVYAHKIKVHDNIIDGTGTNASISKFYQKSGVTLNKTREFEIYNNEFNTYSHGVSLLACNNDVINSFSPSSVYNNVINSTGEGEPGFYFTSTDYVNVFHNTVRSNDTMALDINGCLNLSIQNNIFYSGAVDYVVQVIGSLDTSLFFDFNDYFASNAGKFRINGTTYPTLAAWQAADAGQNAHSISSDPLFTSTTNLQPQASAVNNSGTALGILVDKDGNSRSSFYPDMGAYEFALPCLSSSNGIASNITPNNVQLSWTGGGIAYMHNLEYGQVGFVRGSGTELKGVSNPFLLTGLSPGTAYDFYVEDSCGTDGTSAWAGPFTFTTAGTAPCAPPSSLGADQQNAAGARLYWAAGDAANWNIEYGPTGFLRGTGVYVFDTQNDTLSLTTLLGNTCYDFYVQDSCGLGYVSTWSGPYNFCTQSCMAASNLGADQLSTSIARLFWTAGSADNWNVEYGLTGFALGSGTYVYNAPNDTLSLVNLLGNTCYDYYVQDSCGINSTSNWSGPYNFCTIGCTANAGADASIDVCLTDPQFDLTPFIGSHDAGGIWVDLDASSNLSGSLVIFGPGSSAGTFRAAYVVTEPGCPNDTAIITVNAEAEPNAGADMSFNICDTLSLDLDTVLTGQDAGGTWLDVNNSGGLSGSVVDFSQVAHTNTYLYQYVVLSQGCENDTASLTVRVDSCKDDIGIVEYGIRSLQVYPNPSAGKLQVEFIATAATAQLYLTDLSGKTVYEKMLNNLNGRYSGTIDMSRLAAGTYLLTVESEGVQEVVRVLRSASE